MPLRHPPLPHRRRGLIGARSDSTGLLLSLLGCLDSNVLRLIKKVGASKTMEDKPKYPWRLATNERYREVIKTLMTLTTASFLLPVFFAREFLGLDSKTPLRAVADWTLYWSWALLGLSLFAGIVFHYLSAKWVRMAWGQEAGFLRISVSEHFVERSLEGSFWVTAGGFLGGLALIVTFLYGHSDLPTGGSRSELQRGSGQTLTAPPTYESKGWTQESTGSIEAGPWLNYSEPGTRYYRDAKRIIYRVYPPCVRPYAEPANPFGLGESSATVPR